MSSVDLDKALVAAKVACDIAMNIVRQCYVEKAENQKNGVEATAFEEKSSSIDLVTKYDKLCEEKILESLLTPGNGCEGFKVMAEESWSPKNGDVLTDEPTWIIDPIDGTTSFVHGSFDCSISIGLAVNKQPVVGVVGCPFIGEGEVYWAQKGKGSYCNGKKLNVSAITNLKRACILINPPWVLGDELMAAYLKMHTAFAMLPVNGMRAFGSTAFELVQVAMGRAEMFIEPGSCAWDVCGGILIVEEAGGKVTCMSGKQFDLAKGNLVIATNGTDAVHQLGLDVCGDSKYEVAFKKMDPFKDCQ